MIAYFLDSSAVVKRYGSEAGSAWIKNLTDPVTGNHVYIARITGVEVVSAITRKARSGGLSQADANAALAQFRLELSNLYRPVDITRGLIVKAMQMAELHALRGYDAVQLAAALQLHDERLSSGMSAVTLISADAALNAAAGVEGLAVDDPNAHP